MSLRHYLAAGFILVLTAPSLAQINVSWGAPEPIEDEESTLQSYALPDGKSYALQFRAFFNLSVVVSLYDKEGNRLKQKRLKFEKQNKMWGVAGWLESYVYLNDKWYFITTEPIPAKGGMTLLAWAFDPQNLALAEKPVILSSVEGAGMLRAGRFNYVFNRDYTRMTILEVPGQKKGNEVLWNIKEFNEKLELIRERKVTLPYDYNLFQLNKILLDDQGSLILIASLYKDKVRVSRKGELNYSLMFAGIPYGKEQAHVIPIDVTDAFVHHADCRTLETGNVLGFGLYSKKGTNQAEGLFQYEFTVTGELLRKQVLPFPQPVLQQMLIADSDRGEEEVPYLRINGISKRPDGGIQYVAEQTNNIKQTYTFTIDHQYLPDAVFTTHKNSFKSHNILVCVIYPEAEKNWFTVIRKNQQSLNDGGKFLSYRDGYDDRGNLYILYNDHPENAGKNSNETPQRMSLEDFDTVLATVSADGNVKKASVFNSTKVGYKLLVSSILMKDGRVSFVTLDKKNYRIGSFDLPQ